jgi:hypothetical protein
MPPYPVSILVKPYRGSNQRKREIFTEEVQIAKRLEKYLNDKMDGSAEDRITLIYGYIAVDLGIPPETIVELLAGVGGNNGIQVWKI